MKKIFIAILLITAATCTLSAWNKIELEFQPELKYVNGVVYERVYSRLNEEETYLSSELTWDIENLLLAGGTISADMKKTFMLNVGAWKSINKGTGGMVNKDFMGPKYDQLDVGPEIWTHKSVSTVEIDSLIMDTNIEIDKINGKNFSLNSVLGFRFENWKFSDKLYEATYSLNEPDGLRAWEQNSGGVSGITYEVNKYIPYLGGKLLLDLNKIQIENILTYSPVAYIKTIDHHILKEIYFFEFFNYMQIISNELGISFNFANNFFISSKIKVSHTFNKRGDARVYYESEDEYESSLGPSGYSDLIAEATISIVLKF